MGPIANRDRLGSQGDVEGRELLLDIAEEALAAVHPDRLVPDRLRVDGSTLRIDDRPYDLTVVDEVLVIGAGKGSAHLAAAVCDVVGDRVDGGIVVEKRGQGREIDGVEVLEAGHPFPDEGSHRAAEAVMDLARGAGEGDLVIACITGGASSLLALPVPGISVEELAETTRLLLDAGAPIEDVNAVRKHLSRIKGGRLAAAIHPAAVASLIVVDEVAGEPWGPTVPDPTTFDDAVRAVEKHDLLDRLPEPVWAHLAANRGSSENETPTADDLAGVESRTAIVADAGDVCEAACGRARELGLNAVLLSTAIEGESREVGIALSGIATEVADRERPVEPPCAIVSGGETTVTVDEGRGEATGDGGPNAEFALGVALGIDGRDDVTAIAIDTDGTDGPTDIAGGIVDGGTVARAAGRGFDVYDALSNHDAATVLHELGDAVRTGPTGTNVMDLRVLLVRDRTG